MRLRGLAEATLVIVTATALTVVLTYPLAFRIGHSGRVNTDDGRWSIWVVAWVAHALTTQPLRVYDANIFYPHRDALAFSEANLAAGAIGAPIWLLTKNPYATHNTVVLVGFVVAYTGAYYLLRYLTANRGAAAICAVLYAFCPFVFARTAHIQLLLIGGLPFCMLAFHRLVDRPGIARAVALGIAIWAQALACAYYGIFAALMVGLGTLVMAATRHLWRSRDYWIAIGLAALVSIGLTLPFFAPYLRVQEESGFVRTLDDARQYSANAGAWLASSAWAHRWWLSALGEYNETLFPGMVLTIAGVLGAIRAIRTREDASDSEVSRALSSHWRRDIAALYCAIAAIAFWASFGPDAGLYWLFYKTIPIFSFLRAPGRIGILVTLSFAVLAAPFLAASLSRTRARVAAIAAVMILAVADVFTAPLSQFRDVEPLSSVYRTLKTVPAGPVVEMPYWYERLDFPRHAYYMLNSTAHWLPLVNGYSDHIPEDFRRTVVPISSFPTRESFMIFGRVGVRYVIFHANFYDARSRQRLLERLDRYAQYLRPLARDGDVWLYEIVDWPN